MKIAYLHGLESNIDQKDPKIIFLNTFDEVYTPSINYKDPSTFNKLFKDIKKMQPDLIVGSSMGGYVSYLIGSKLAIPTLLFNPAMVGRSMDPIVDLTGLRGSKHTVYFGKSDNVIDGSAVRQYFNDKGVGSFDYNLYSGGHRVPVDVFINTIKQILGITEIYNKNTNNNMKKTFSDFLKESETVHHSNDFLGMQANMANMTREEWIAHYGTATIGSGIDEKNADGTISDDEDEEMEYLITDLNFMLDEIIHMVKTKTEEIGGSFRSPGYTAQCVKIIKDKLKKAKML